MMPAIYIVEIHVEDGAWELTAFAEESDAEAFINDQLEGGKEREMDVVGPTRLDYAENPPGVAKLVNSICKGDLEPNLDVEVTEDLKD
jgi:hypothetical protein